MKRIGIETTKYSAVIKAVLDTCSRATVLINGSIESRHPDEWCTNRFLESTRDFMITQDGKEILSFHDHPRELLAPIDSLLLIEDLSSRRLLRYRIIDERTREKVIDSKLKRIWCSYYRAFVIAIVAFFITITVALLRIAQWWSDVEGEMAPASVIRDSKIRAIEEWLNLALVTFFITILCAIAFEYAYRMRKRWLSVLLLFVSPVLLFFSGAAVAYMPYRKDFEQGIWVNLGYIPYVPFYAGTVALFFGIVWRLWDRRFGSKLVNQSLKFVLLPILLSLGMGSVQCQTFVYSGREYLKVGTSYSQIRLMDLKSGKQAQLSKSSKDHEIPWCTSDGSIFFTTYSEKAIYRLDRSTNKESRVMGIAQYLRAFIGELDDQQVVVQEVGEDFEIEILDLKTARSIKRFAGVSPSISPDHKSIAYESSSHVYVIDVLNGNVLDIGEGATPAFFPTGNKIAYTKPQISNDVSQIEIVIYDLKTGSKDSNVFAASEKVFQRFYDLTIAPDELTMILSVGSGGHGSGVYYLLGSGKATIIDEQLGRWSGWASSGLLLYDTERALRSLDAGRQVWTNDIKVFDFHTGKVRTIIKGISVNLDPSWCNPSKN
jgi:hypothetical protein